MRIGFYNPRCHTNKDKHDLDSINIKYFNNTSDYSVLTLLLVLYFYIIIVIMSTSMSILIDNDVGIHNSQFLSCFAHPSMAHLMQWYSLPGSLFPYIKLAYTIIVFSGARRYILNRFKNNILCEAEAKTFSVAAIFFGNHTSRVKQLLAILLLSLLTLNFLLIALTHPNLLNPGPQNLTVYYQNVQGLIPFSNLANDSPSLDRTKLFELNTHINTEKPDVVILNETWLKKSIKDNEIIDNQTYKVFRKDRSKLSHPTDTNNPHKYKTNGGGILIAIRSDLDGTSKRISLKNGAEIVATEITLNGSKFIFCTCYRVGTLGLENHKAISESIKSFYQCKKPKRIFIIGDFNLSSVSWPLDDNTPIENSIENTFIDTFTELGLSQLINRSTHTKGKILDILLTNSDKLVSNINILEHNSVCRSDHFPINFEIKTNVKRKKPTKRKIYNFKRADWDALNNDLCNVNWDAMLASAEPELAWSKFKHNLFYFVDKHIPTITMKSEFQPPWFDSELFEACRSKNRAHATFKRTKSDKDVLKYSNLRRNLKKLACQKMRDNMYNSDDPALITKKFWSHVKHASNSHRLPECMYYKGNYRNNSLDIANLFNKFFCEQFSEKSLYNIKIDYDHDDQFNIPFCHARVRKMLLKINSSKACGPDKIHGKILRNCAVSLAYPLSLMFKVSYNTGCVPKEWKLAHIVPIHKKGCKENIENYRPISLTSLIMKTFERILKEEIIFRTSHLLDSRQHGFLSNKSCTTNMVGFCDNLVLSLNDCIRTDVVYFDFSKAFDSVNHDLMLEKLKSKFNINGRFLKFIVNYLAAREQCVLVSNSKSAYKPVLSGVPQGSILGQFFLSSSSMTSQKA